MAIDLSGYTKGTKLAVRTRNGAVVELEIGAGRDEWPHLVRGCVTVDDDGLAGSEHKPWRDDDVLEIIGQAKLPTDITAADLDSLIITTKDGTRVLFADDTARLQDRSGRIHGGTAWTSWQIGGNVERERDAYAAELERRRNPPLEIVWRDQLTIKGMLAQAWCDVRGDIWRITMLDDRQYRIYLGMEYRTYADSVAEAEQYIRDHYKDRAAST